MYISSSVLVKLPGTGPQIVWVLGSPKGGGREDHLSATQAVNHSADAPNKLFSRPTLHNSCSGTFWTGRESLILQDEYFSILSIPVTSLKYLRFMHVICYIQTSCKYCHTQSRGKAHPIGWTEEGYIIRLDHPPTPTHPPTLMGMDCNSATTGRILYKFYIYDKGTNPKSTEA